jgi:hypothetical protein
MKARRRPVKPKQPTFQREVRHRRGGAPAPPEAGTLRRASPDRGAIRNWHDDDLQREEDEFNRKSRAEQYQAMIAEWVSRHRQANDPDVWNRLGAQQVARHVINELTWFIQRIGGPDPRYVFRPYKSCEEELGRAIDMQFPGLKKVVTDPKAPKKRTPWWAFIKDLRKLPF